MENLTQQQKGFATSEALYTKLQNLKTEAINVLTEKLNGEKIELEDEPTCDILDARGNTILGFDAETVYTDSGDYNIWDAEITDIIYFIDNF